MQKLYWRPAHISRVVHTLVGVIAVAILLAAERFQVVLVQPNFEEKLAAAQLMRRGMDTIRVYRVRHVAPIDLSVDPTGSGMVGVANSSTTTNTGSLEAKRTTANPNWAAVAVDLLLEAGVQRGDLIAFGVSGSFPAMNLAAFAAAETLGLEVVSIAGVGASSFGANFSQLTWLDMERILNDEKVISHRTIASSLGGAKDRALGITQAGRKRLRSAITRNDADYIDVTAEVSSIDLRMTHYENAAQGRRYVTYVNVGGSLASIGPKSVKRIYRPGLILKPDPRATDTDSVMMRFLRQGIPVVNLSKIASLAESYGLPVEPEELPQVGGGLVFEKREHNRPLLAGLLVFLLFTLYALLKLELGARLTATGSRRRKLERMV